jgi:hypothetical protein
VLQQPSQLIPQTTNQNTHSSSPPPLAATPSSTYPYPQYNHNSNAAMSGHPGQPPFPIHLYNLFKKKESLEKK